MEAVRRQALLTFSRKNLSHFEENFNSLVSAMSTITKEEVGLDDSLTKDTRSAPVTYVNILQHEDVTISMFVLRHKSKLPLHDHPLMHGVIKVVSGIVQIQNYSFIEDPSDVVRHRIVCARRESPKIVGVNDSPVVLTPANGNIHEITCTNHDGAAFVDVLAPPYGSLLPTLGPRPCFYYFEAPDQPAHSEIVKFIKSQNHPEFWTDDAPYLENLLKNVATLEIRDKKQQ